MTSAVAQAYNGDLGEYRVRSGTGGHGAKPP